MVFVSGAFCDTGALPPFKFHLKATPRTLDPTKMTAGESTYMFSQLYRGLLRFDGVNQLIFDQAKKCRSKIETELICEIRKEARWNDGAPVTAEDFVRAFRRLVSPDSTSPIVDLLLGVKNAKSIYDGKLPPESLGVKVTSDGNLQITLNEKDTEFLEKLSNPLLVPYRAPKDTLDFTTFYTNGPYKIKSWVRNQKIELAPMDSYFGGKTPRPPVEIYFASEDSAGMTLYEKGVINFLTRVTTINIPKYKERPDFIQIPLARYDYVGFNLRSGSPFEKKEVREAFVHAVNFEELKRILFALGAPGCPSFAEPFLNPDGHCQDYVENQPKLSISKPVKFMFSQLGGDDVRRQGEWFQEQWRSHLGVKLEIRDMEQKQFRALLRKSPPDAFRMGVPLEWPACSAALRKFMKDNADNFIGFNNAHFDNLVKALTTQKLSLSEKASICGVASDILFKEEYVGIPMGQMHFTMLCDPKYKGWTINQLNQLDLSQLTYSK